METQVSQNFPTSSPLTYIIIKIIIIIFFLLLFLLIYYYFFNCLFIINKYFKTPALCSALSGCFGTQECILCGWFLTILQQSKQA